MADNVIAPDVDFAAWKAESTPAAEPSKEEPAEVQEVVEESVAPAEDKPQEAESEPESDTGDDKDESEPEHAKAKPGRRERAITNRDRKIGELTAKNQDQERRIAELVSRLTPKSVEPSGYKWDGKTKPEYASYEGNEEQYFIDLGRYGARLESDQQKADADKSQQAAKQRTFDERVSQGRAKYDDFDDVALSAEVPASQEMLEAIIEHPDGADIAYFLGKHPDEARRIAELKPAAAVREIGKIAETLKTDSPKAKPTPKVAPPKPIELGMSRTKTTYDVNDFQGWKSSIGANRR